MIRETILMAAVALSGCGGTGTTTKTSREVEVTPVEMAQTITLRKPSATQGATINQALEKRCSSREYATDPLSLEELSGVLWAAAGVNRQDGHLTSPSALGLYPIRIYAFFKEGVYRYDSQSNTLERVVRGDHRDVSAMQDFAYTAPLNLVYVADLSVYEGRSIPAEHVRYLCGQDAAGYAENVNLYAAGHSLKSVTRGSLKEAETLHLLQLDSARYFTALAQTVGK